MKRFILSSSLFVLGIFTILVVSAFFMPDNSIKNSMLGVQRVKLEMLRATEGNRLIFLGGSNLSHGLDSPEIERELDVTVVNMGLHASLGLRYIMWSTIDHIRKGDVVIIVPEYPQFGSAFNGSAELLAMVADIIPEHKAILNKSQWIGLVEHIPRYGAGKLCRLKKCFRVERFIESEKYNIQGDLKATDSTEPLPYNKGAGFVGKEAFDKSTVKQIKEFVVAVESKGARAFLMPPCFQRTSFTRQREYIEVLESALAKEGISFIVPPSLFALDDSLFYDTPYHLNAKGYPVRTKIVIDVLKLFVNSLSKK